MMWVKSETDSARSVRRNCSCQCGFLLDMVQSKDGLPRQFAFRTAMPYILCHEEPQRDTEKTFEFRGSSLAECSHATLSCTVP